MIIPIHEIDKFTCELKKITSKEEWTGQETGIILVSRAIELYIKKNYDLYQELDFFNFDMEKYTTNYKKIGNQLLREHNENGSYLAGYIKINDFFYNNSTYTIANEETIKARYLYFYEKLKLALTIEQVENTVINTQNEKGKLSYEQNLKQLSLIACKDKAKKIKETIEDFESALFWLKGYRTLLELIRKIYKLNLLFLMYKEIDIFIEETQQRADTYNKVIDNFKGYITNYTKNDKQEKIAILENTFKKINYDYEIPNKKIKRAIEIMKTPNEKTKENFYCFDSEILLDLLCERSENE